MISPTISSKILPVSILAGPSARTLVREIVAADPNCQFGLLSSDVEVQEASNKLVTEQLVSTNGGYNPDQIRAQITAIAAKGPIEHLIIECDERTHPIALASLFLLDQGDNQRFLEAARLNSILVAVDAKTLLHSIVHGEPVSNVISPCILADQIECANVIVLNGHLPDRDFLLTQAVIYALNPNAQIENIGQAQLPKLLDTRRAFEPDAAMAGWQKLMEAEATTRRLDQGVTAFAYRARRPFHPERFWNRIQNPFMGVFRAKGFFWLATQMDLVGGINIAGSECHYSPAGQWWAARAQDHGRDPCIPDRLRNEWSEPYGDRRQAIAFMGIDVDPVTLSAELDACLLTDSEMQLGEKGRATLADPFPAWGARAHHHECKEENCCHH